jgi:hypothetical protein
MATQPKPKPKPEPDPPEPDEDDGANHDPIPTEASKFEQRLDALAERVEKLEERANAPPIGLGRRP